LEIFMSDKTQGSRARMAAVAKQLNDLYEAVGLKRELTADEAERLRQLASTLIEIANADDDPLESLRASAAHTRDVHANGPQSWQDAIMVWNSRQCDATWRRIQAREPEPCVYASSVLRWLQETYPALAVGVTEEMVTQGLRDVGFPIDDQGQGGDA
jgi:hypothetical protein